MRHVAGLECVAIVAHRLHDRWHRLLPTGVERVDLTILEQKMRVHGETSLVEPKR